MSLCTNTGVCRAGYTNKIHENQMGNNMYFCEAVAKNCGQLIAGAPKWKIHRVEVWDSARREEIGVFLRNQIVGIDEMLETRHLHKNLSKLLCTVYSFLFLWKIQNYYFAAEWLLKAIFSNM